MPKHEVNITCEDYLKTNLIYDLSTNNVNLAGFTDIFYYELRHDTKAGFNLMLDRLPCQSLIPNEKAVSK